MPKHEEVQIGQDNRSDIRTLVEFLNMTINSSEPVFAKFEALPGVITNGSGSSKYVYVPGSRANRVLLIAHADTVWEDEGERKNRVYYEKGIFKSNDPQVGLGADDRAGCAMVWLMRNSGHSLLITGGEEIGGIASNFIVKSQPDIYGEINKKHAFVVQLDRRNAKDFKCYDVGSKDFRAHITSQLKDYNEPDRSSFTDISFLCTDICGVNLSVGYYNEHSPEEYLVVSEWLNTLNHIRTWLSRTDLPTCMQDKEPEKDYRGSEDLQKYRSWQKNKANTPLDNRERQQLQNIYNTAKNRNDINAFSDSEINRIEDFVNDLYDRELSEQDYEMLMFLVSAGF